MSEKFLNLEGLEKTIDHLRLKRIDILNIPVDKWIGSAPPYTCTISVSPNSHVGPLSYVIVTPQKNMTTEEMDAWLNALIIAGDCNNNTIVLYAYGVKPTQKLSCFAFVGIDVAEFTELIDFGN